LSGQATRAARDGIVAMLDESRSLSLGELVALRKAGVWKPRSLYLFHDFTQMLLVLAFDGVEPVVLTLFSPNCLRKDAA
jgi:hypothetical protein